MTGSRNRGQTIFAAYDRSMRHHAANVGNDRFDFTKNGRPARGCDRRNKDFALLNLAEIIGRPHDTRPTFDNSWRCGHAGKRL